jgi:enamine deaminase RidA (YjgF/YER057c/UK114 family)
VLLLLLLLLLLLIAGTETLPTFPPSPCELPLTLLHPNPIQLPIPIMFAAKLLSRTSTPLLRRLVHTEAEMAKKGIVLPAYQDAVWSYVKGQWDGDNLHIGDHVGQRLNEATGGMETVRGKVGTGPDADVTPEEAELLCAQAALRLLSTAQAYCEGDLDKVVQCIKLVGYVNGEPNFIGHGKVVNGASNMLVEVLGDRGKHARSCIGAGSSPAAVTVEATFKIVKGVGGSK